MLTADQETRILQQMTKHQKRMGELVEAHPRLGQLLAGTAAIAQGLNHLGEVLNPLGVTQINELAARGDWFNANLKGEAVADEVGLGTLRSELKALTDRYIREYDPQLADEMAALEKEVHSNAA